MIPADSTPQRPVRIIEWDALSPAEQVVIVAEAVVAAAWGGEDL